MPIKLTEKVVFGQDKLGIIKKCLAQSNAQGLNFDEMSDSDKEFIDRLINDLSEGNSKANPYLILKACQKGPDTDQNPALDYVCSIGEYPSSGAWNHPNYVDSIIDKLNSGEISCRVNKEFCKYLVHKGLYTRNDRDFLYTVLAFDAVIDPSKRKKFFTGIQSNGTVPVDFSSEEEAKKFFGEDIGFYFKSGDDVGDEDEPTIYEGDTVTSDCPVDQRFFFVNMKVSMSDEIIPAGVQSSESGERTIWNYMDIWENAKTKEASEKETKGKKRGPRDSTKLKKYAQEIQARTDIPDSVKVDLLTKAMQLI